MIQKSVNPVLCIIKVVSYMDFGLCGDLLRIAATWKYNIVAKRCSERDKNMAA